MIDLIPSERRYTGMVKVVQEVGDSLKLTGDLGGTLGTQAVAGKIAERL